jgi:hypothetical protein
MRGARTGFFAAHKFGVGRHKFPHQLYIFVVDGNFCVLAKVALLWFGINFLDSSLHHKCLFFV